MSNFERSILLVVVSCTVLGVAALRGQTTAPGTAQAAIVATVIDAMSRAPLAEATVTVTPVSVGMGSARFRRSSDPRGRVEFGSLPVGSYEVVVAKAGYLPGRYGMNGPWDPGVPAIRLQPNERRELTIRAWRYGSIEGAVYDEGNQPAVDARIQLLQRTEFGWARARRPAQTDDRGVFRVGPLAPGDYIAVLLNSPMPSEATGGILYPGVSDLAGATIIQVQPGEDKSGIVFTRERQSVGSGFRVEGRLSDVLDGLVLHLRPDIANDALADVQELTAQTMLDGRFSFPSVPAGEFRISGWRFPDLPKSATVLDSAAVSIVMSGMPGRGLPLAPLPSAPTMVVDRRVSVATNVSNLALDVRPGAHIVGRVAFDGTTLKVDPSKLPSLAVIVRPTTGRNLGKVPQTRVEIDGTFRSIGLPAGQYVVGIMPSLTPDFAGWELSSVRSGPSEFVGRAVPLGASDVDLLLTLTDRRAEIQGTVVNGAGAPEPYARILIFPRDKSRWETPLPLPAPACIVLATADESGAFSASVLPGQYLVSAVKTLPEFGRSAEFLSTLVASSSPVSIGLGEKKSVSVKSVARR